jgi:cobalt/nickel transport system permease protein
VVSVSLPPGAWLAFGTLAAVLVGLVVAARLRPRHVLRRMTVEVPFLLAAAVLPFTVEDGVVLGVTVGAKITIGVLAMVILSSTTPFPRLLRGFELLRTPRPIVVIVAFMWRYLHVLGEQVSNMQTARAARGYSARFFWQAAASTGSLVCCPWYPVRARYRSAIHGATLLPSIVSTVEVPTYISRLLWCAAQ